MAIDQANQSKAAGLLNAMDIDTPSATSSDKDESEEVNRSAQPYCFLGIDDGAVGLHVTL